MMGWDEDEREALRQCSGVSLGDEDTVLREMQHSGWADEVSAGRVSVEDAALAQSQGVAPPAEDEAPGYAQLAVAADFALAEAGEGRGLQALLAGHALSFGEYRRLVAAGCHEGWLANLNVAGDLGAARVDLSADGSRFQLGGPDPRLIVGVRDAAFQLVDLVALASHDEDRWSLLLGVGDMLGAWWIEDMHRRVSTERPARLRLFATPWDWLRGGGQGVCVLEWSAAALGELRLLGERVTIECRDAAHRAEISGKLQRGGLPMVALPPSAAAGLSLAERIGMGARHG